MVDQQDPPVDTTDKGTQPPAQGEGAGQGQVNSQAPLNLPDKFKGKSPEEIAVAYIELESKLGAQSKDVEEARKMREQVDTLLKAVWADPDLYRQVEQGIQKYTSGGTLPNERETPKKGDEGAQPDKENPMAPKVDELKMAEENRILGEFFTKYGYTNLPEKERKDNYGKLSLALAELVDPGGKKPIAEILSSIPLTKLPRFLENAHRIANYDMIVDQAKQSALITDRENQSATIGSFSATPSSGRDEGSVSLSQKERDIAQKMGISEEKYAKRKSQIQKEASRFN